MQNNWYFRNLRFLNLLLIAYMGLEYAQQSWFVPFELLRLMRTVAKWNNSPKESSNRRYDHILVYAGPFKAWFYKVFLHYMNVRWRTNLLCRILPLRAVGIVIISALIRMSQIMIYHLSPSITGGLWKASLKWAPKSPNALPVPALFVPAWQTAIRTVRIGAAKTPNLPRAVPLSEWCWFRSINLLKSRQHKAEIYEGWLPVWRHGGMYANVIRTVNWNCCDYGWICQTIRCFAATACRKIRSKIEKTGYEASEIICFKCKSKNAGWKWYVRNGVPF